MANEYMYKSDQDLLLLAQQVADLLSCAAFISNANDENQHVHMMTLMGIAERLSDELANALDKSFLMMAEGERK
ncbi:aminotransferase [Enterobacter asburiae]|uniref:aminotransferase n=1 Tax=Enterobacter asburiae TaxID=61645 RepID=UPI002004B015|nr:aminotransferase [Enterobacter asburiae]